MATIYWLGTAVAVAELNTVTVGGTLAGETFTISINGKVIASHTDTDTVIATTVAALVAAWNLSTIAYATGITAADASPDITLTADTAGVPFDITLNTPGGSATFANVVTTEATGPNHWDDADNWSGGLVTVNTDTVIFEDNSINVAFGLAQSAVSLTLFTIKKTYTGRIGLDYRTFATSSDGATTNATEVEYRDIYLAIGSTTVNIGEQFGPGNPNGSGRIMLDLGTVESTVTIFGTAQAPTEVGRTAIRLKANLSTTDIFVRSAPGGVGVAAEVPGETSTIRKISVSDVTASSRVELGDGTTITTWEQTGGNNVLQAAATITTLKMAGGILLTEGDYTVTTLNMTGGTYNSNHIKAGGDAITTANLDGGSLNTLGSSVARTFATVNINKGAVLTADGAVLTITTLNEEAGFYTVTVS